MNINEKLFNEQVDRNLKGIELEKQGNIDAAIELYEQNIYGNFDGNHPYDRLIIIYKKRGQIDDVKRVLNKAIYVFENVVSSKRADRLPKLNKYKDKLLKLKEHNVAN